MPDLDAKTEKMILIFALIIDIVTGLMFATALIFLITAIITASRGQIFVTLFTDSLYLFFILLGSSIRKMRLASFK